MQTHVLYNKVTKFRTDIRCLLTRPLHPFYVRLTRCCPKHAPLHHPQCPFIQMIDTDATLLLDYTNLTTVIWI
jgi:hypothetical protein